MCSGPAGCLALWPILSKTNSFATDVESLRNDFNALLQKLKDSKLMR